MRFANAVQLALLAGIVAAQNGSSYSVKTPPLDTPWTYQVGTNPWTEYPRPQLQRSEWQNLNGIWRYQNASSLNAVNNPPFNSTLANEVLIPSCLESGLSGTFARSNLRTSTDSFTGIQGTNAFYSWFSTSFTVPTGWTGDRVLLNFGAVDYEATVFVNGENVTFHRGGYFRFSVDVTEYLSASGTNDLYVLRSLQTY